MVEGLDGRECKHWVPRAERPVAKAMTVYAEPSSPQELRSLEALQDLFRPHSPDDIGVARSRKSIQT